MMSRPSKGFLLRGHRRFFHKTHTYGSVSMPYLYVIAIYHQEMYLRYVRVYIPHTYIRIRHGRWNPTTETPHRIPPKIRFALRATPAMSQGTLPRFPPPSGLPLHHLGARGTFVKWNNLSKGMLNLYKLHGITIEKYLCFPICTILCN